MSKTCKPFDELIENSGLKYSAVAEKMGIDQSRLYKIRINPKKLKFDQAEVLSSIIGVELPVIYATIKNFTP
jgi:predicted transcriptional regulator